MEVHPLLKTAFSINFDNNLNKLYSTIYLKRVDKNGEDI